MSTNNNGNKGGPKVSGESKKAKKSTSSSPVSTKGLNHYGVFLDKTESESVLALQIMMAVAKANGEKTSTKGNKNATMTLAKYRAESVVGVLKNKPWREFFDANKIENVDDRNTPGRHPVPGEQILLSNKNNSFNPSRSRNENLLSTDSILTSFSTTSVENVGNSALNPTGIDRESKAIRMIRRIQVLWDELKIPNDDRNFYMSTLCQLAYPCPSVEQMDELTKHIVMLLHHRKATIEVLKQIENRELLLKKILKDLAGIQKKSFAALTDASSYNWKKELLQLFVDLQIATLVVIHRIQMWRRNLWRPFPFIWKKSNYIYKIKSDLELLNADFYRNLLDSFPLARKDLLCLVFESPEDMGADNNNNKDKSATNNTHPTPTYDDVDEEKDLRSFFISSGTTLYKRELQAAARVIQEESLLQCALKVEHEALRTRGVFIPTLRVDTSMMQDSQEGSLKIRPVDGGSHRVSPHLHRDEEEEDPDNQRPANNINRNTRKSEPETDSRKSPPAPASTSPSSLHSPSPKGYKSPNNAIDYKMLAFQSDKLSSDDIENDANNVAQGNKNGGGVAGGESGGDNLRDRMNELSTHSNSASLTGVANFLPFDPIDPLEASEASEAGDTDIDLDDLLDVSLDPSETAEIDDDDDDDEM